MRVRVRLHPRDEGRRRHQGGQNHLVSKPSFCIRQLTFHQCHYSHALAQNRNRISIRVTLMTMFILCMTQSGIAWWLLLHLLHLVIVLKIEGQGAYNNFKDGVQNYHAIIWRWACTIVAFVPFMSLLCFWRLHIIVINLPGHGSERIDDRSWF